LAFRLCTRLLALVTLFWPSWWPLVWLAGWSAVVLLSWLAALLPIVVWLEFFTRRSSATRLAGALLSNSSPLYLLPSSALPFSLNRVSVLVALSLLGPVVGSISCSIEMMSDDGSKLEKV
jgi:hypothetical protein